MFISLPYKNLNQPRHIQKQKCEVNAIQPFLFEESDDII